MSGPEPGDYRIISTIPAPVPPVGVKSNDPAFILPVILGGLDNVFAIAKVEEGKYTITATADSPRPVMADKDCVVAILGCPDPSVSEWYISGSDGGPYVISLPTDLIGAIQCWTLDTSNLRPDHPVVLRPYTPDMDQPTWNFVPAAY